MTIGFAHRGAPRSRHEHNRLTAFERALALGAVGLEADISLTADGVPVLVHTGLVPGGARVSQLRRHELPADIPSLADLYRHCGVEFELSLDMAEPRAAEAVVRTAEEHGAVDRLWLTYWQLPAMENWRAQWPRLHLVYAAMPLGSKRAARVLTRLSAGGIDAINVYHRLCSARLTGQAHELDVRVFAWGIRSRRRLERVIRYEVDGVYCDDVEAMVSVLGNQERQRA